MLPIRDTNPSRHTPVMMRLLVLASAGVFVTELMLPEDQLVATFHLFGIVPARFSDPQWAVSVGFPTAGPLPFISSLFLHAGWLHVIGNMWTFWIFGDNVEDRMGPLRFLAFYLVCGVIAGLTHWFADPGSAIPTIGASGAIAGVLGAYFVMYPLARVLVMIPIFFWPFFFEVPAVVFLVIWFLMQLGSGTVAMATAEAVGGIAWWAHVGGFVAGVLLHRLFFAPARRVRG